MADAAVAALLVIGAVFILLAAVGLTRMPDLFLRLSCSSKASTLGILAILVAAGLHFADLGVAGRAAAGAVFLLVTMPVAGQTIARAAYLLGVPLWTGTVADAMRERR
jgi:multicomponent Na+:H+ antiporter subunit G